MRMCISTCRFQFQATLLDLNIQNHFWPKISLFYTLQDCRLSFFLEINSHKINATRSTLVHEINLLQDELSQDQFATKSTHFSVLNKTLIWTLKALIIILILLNSDWLAHKQHGTTLQNLKEGQVFLWCEFHKASKSYTCQACRQGGSRWFTFWPPKDPLNCTV